MSFPVNHAFMPNCGSREGTDSCWLCWLPAARHSAEPAPNPDPLRPLETDAYPDDDEDRGVWAGVAFVLTVALAALVIGFAIGRVTA